MSLVSYSGTLQELKGLFNVAGIIAMLSYLQELQGLWRVKKGEWATLVWGCFWFWWVCGVWCVGQFFRATWGSWYCGWGTGRRAKGGSVTVCVNGLSLFTKAFGPVDMPTHYIYNWRTSLLVPLYLKACLNDSLAGWQLSRLWWTREITHLVRLGGVGACLPDLLAWTLLNLLYCRTIRENRGSRSRSMRRAWEGHSVVWNTSRRWQWIIPGMANLFAWKYWGVAGTTWGRA